MRSAARTNSQANEPSARRDQCLRCAVIRSRRGCVPFRGRRRDPRVLRYTVPVDDDWHEITLSGEILHVAIRSSQQMIAPDVVELWALADGNSFERRFRVFGTGQILPSDRAIEHVGTAFALGGELVWHLFEDVS